MKIVGVIPARYASTRFPGKPLADICGKPMIWWVYQQAKKVRELDEVYVATDDERIETVCNEYGMLVVMTSSHHKTGTDRVAEVATKVDGDFFVNIQGDEPVIPPEMLVELIKSQQNSPTDFLTLCTKITSSSLIESKNTVKVIRDIHSNAIYFSRTVIPFAYSINNLQVIYRHIGVYAYSKEFLLTFANLKQSSLELIEGIEPLRAIENGLKIRVLETDFTSMGVDTPEDLERVQTFIQKGVINDTN